MSGQGPPPWEQGEPPPHHPQYPHQELLPQEIKPGRNRRPLFIGLGVVLAMVVGGTVAYLVLRDDGEGSRQAYCAALRDLTHDGDLTEAFDSADGATLDQVHKVADLAPNAVHGDWSTLQDIVATAKSGSPDYTQALAAYGALRGISSDAKQHCDLDLDIPMM